MQRHLQKLGKLDLVKEPGWLLLLQGDSSPQLFRQPISWNNLAAELQCCI